MGGRGSRGKMGNDSKQDLQNKRSETRVKYKDFDSATDFNAENKYFENVAIPWWDNLSSKEKDAVVAYTGSTYREMNEYLRDGKMGSGESPYMEKLIKEAYNGLKQFKLQTNLQLYRQSSTSLFSELTNLPRLGHTKESMQEWVNAMKGYVGSRVTDKGFTSTSTRNDVWGGSVYMKIMAPKGTNGAYVERISLHPSEKEFILNHGTHFKITGAHLETIDGEVRPVVTMKIVKR